MPIYDISAVGFVPQKVLEMLAKVVVCGREVDRVLLDGLEFHSTTHATFVASSLKRAFCCCHEEELDLFC